MNLPAPNTRMTAKRKAAIIQLLDRGMLSMAEALSHYSLTEEEIGHWRKQDLVGRYFDRLA